MHFLVCVFCFFKNCPCFGYEKTVLAMSCFFVAFILKLGLDILETRSPHGKAIILVSGTAQYIICGTSIKAGPLAENLISVLRIVVKQ